MLFRLRKTECYSVYVKRNVIPFEVESHTKRNVIPFEVESHTKRNNIPFYKYYKKSPLSIFAFFDFKCAQNIRQPVTFVFLFNKIRKKWHLSDTAKPIFTVW
jgi:predicted LPLAT superfamily acyltransferase